MVSYRILLVASIAAIGADAAVAAQAPAQAGARPAMQLTALDYIEIEQLTRKYAWAIDTCSNDGFDYADLYTPDGAFIDGETGRRWQGREQLAEAAGGNGRGCPFPKMPLSHLILNLVIEPTADGADRQVLPDLSRQERPVRRRKAPRPRRRLSGHFRQDGRWVALQGAGPRPSAADTGRIQGRAERGARVREQDGWR